MDHSSLWGNENIERKRVAAYTASCLLCTTLVKREGDEAVQAWPVYGDCRRFLCIVFVCLDEIQSGIGFLCRFSSSILASIRSPSLHRQHPGAKQSSNMWYAIKQ